LQGFVTGHGIEFWDIGPAPSQAQYEQAVTDNAQRSSLTRPWAAYTAAKELYNPKDKAPFTQIWFNKIAEGCIAFQPDVLVLVFTAWCGAAAIPALLGLPTRVVLSYPMPMAPSSEFSVSMAGTGFSLKWAWLNKLQWRLSERMIVQKIHLKAAKRNVEAYIQERKAATGDNTVLNTIALDDTMNTGGLPGLFAFSPAVLPKPADWPKNFHVIGQLSKKRSALDEHKPLPPRLQAYINDCRKKDLHVIYIGFGSLGFFPPARVTAILDTVAAAVTEVAASYPFRAVIQTTLSSTPGKTGSLTVTSVENGDDSEQHVPPFFTFSESVDHSALFPQTSLVVSHGGIGTVSTALASGKPVLSMCCLPTADQSFWADLCQKRRLGPQWFWVDALTPKRMKEGIVDAINNFEEYTKNAEKLAKEMAKDDAVSVALKVLEAEAAEARKNMPAVTVQHPGATAQAHVQLKSNVGIVKGGAGGDGKVKIQFKEEDGNRVRIGFVY
jgi:UDP:flavonoid glycosyltransferase YjiC (YdhE family)